MFFNNVPLVHKLALPIATGQWYFDYGNDVIYVADDPTGQVVELAVAKQAFSGAANGVTIQNLIVEKYASPLNSGAISPYGSNWTIKANEVRLNHGAGIKPQYGSDNDEQILSNNVHDNGQEGIAVGGGNGTLVAYNSVSSNDFAFVLGENGGGKIAATTNAQVLNNNYAKNNGVGLWADCGAINTLLSGNTVTNSQLDGIRYEISHSGMITNNTLINNAWDKSTQLCSKNSREIVLADSDNTTVSGNTITTSCAGITLTQGSRNLEINDIVIDNVIRYSGSLQLRNPIGGMNPNPPFTLFDPANANYFDYNVYHFIPSTLALKNWVYNTTSLSWVNWQATGQDIHGTAD